MMGACKSTIIEVIPDREQMIAAVDAIVAFEAMLKKGEHIPAKDVKRVQKITREMKALGKQ